MKRHIKRKHEGGEAIKPKTIVEKLNKTAGGCFLKSRLVSKEISPQNKSCLEKALALLPLVFGVLKVLGVLGDPLVLEYEL